MCVPKQDHDCTKHTNTKLCKQVSVGGGEGIFKSANRHCLHRCTGVSKKAICNKIKNKSGKKNHWKVWDKKNPCFKCHVWSFYGGADDEASLPCPAGTLLCMPHLQWSISGFLAPIRSQPLCTVQAVKDFGREIACTRNI